jgi:RsiW-degrading membrane proteinase PrsW (M82 family)
MSRNNMLYLLVGALVVAVAVIGYYEYQDRHQKQAAGLNINIGPAGIHVGGGTSK